MIAPRYFWTSVACGLLAVAGCGLGYFHGKKQGLPYHDSFSSGVTAEWHALGGGWDVYEGGIRNNSDERGAKFLTGSSTWTNYSAEADILLLGNSGDAGLIVRSNDEEEGVDAYSGYYAGLRDRDDTLTIGRADHGWIEYGAVPISGGVHPFHWYHLKIIAVGCGIAALASDSETHSITAAAIPKTDCVKTGRMGLRSYSSGGIWKNVRVSAATPTDLAAMMRSVAASGPPEIRQSEAGFNSPPPNASGTALGLAGLPLEGAGNVNVHTLPLNSLRLVSSLHPVQATVRGSVVLTSPSLYIQDSTAGIEIDSPQSSFLKIGDEIEATGTVAPRGFGGMLQNAKVRLLWSRGPAPPLSVTASQAATGRFDGMFMEIQGRLEERPRVAGRSVILNLRSGHQSYPAVFQGARPDLAFPKLQPNSLLRLRGVCVVDPTYTKNLTAFALLLRSSQDVALVAGPPWWDKRHLVEIILAVMILSFIGVFIYARVERWRLQAVLEERSRMAREIHDTLAQSFAGIALQLASALREPQSGTAGSDAVEMAFHMAEQSRREAHRSIAALRTLHTDEPLEAMLQKVLRPQLAGSHVELSVSRTGTAQRLSAACESQLIRLAQEAVANAVQHACSSKIEVNLSFEPEELRLDIIDNGQGFDPSQVPTIEDGHFGIAGMKERAVSIRAEFKIESGPAGTRVSILVPAARRHPRFWKFARLRTRHVKPPAEPHSYAEAGK